MAIDLTQIREKLGVLTNKNEKNTFIWKPTPGKTQIRIVPNQHSPEYPFVDLSFHYGINNKTYLSPSTFGRPDPILEFANKLIKSGDKDSWKLGKKLEPKIRTHVPIIVRGQEAEGVKFWAFGKQIYEQLLKIIADEDYGDITDPKSGRDIVVEFKTAKEAQKDFPETTIMVKPNKTPVTENKEIWEKIKQQKNVVELFTEPSYEDLQEAMEKHLNPEKELDEEVPAASNSLDFDTPKAEEASSTVVDKSKVENAVTAFDDLFNS